MRADHSRPGAIAGHGMTTFSVWAPYLERVDLHIVWPFDKVVTLERDEGGHHTAAVEAVHGGTRYLYRLDGHQERPDPASLSQPEGVHGPSEVVDTAFDWTDDGWTGIPLRDYV